MASVGGVKFVRSKNGNLYRSGIVKNKRQNRSVKKISQPCKSFTTTGSCSKGPLCPYIHDPNKVAICKAYLQSGTCPAGSSCDLSHDPTPERVPACVHFLRGKCSNANCRYAHVRVNPGAPVCRAFASLGFCERGATCTERHVFECPDYANKGSCNNKKCRLPHVDRAGQIRKIAANAVAESNQQKEDVQMKGDDESDVTSEGEEIDSDDIDSEGLVEDLSNFSAYQDNASISGQQDYIHL
ncbi:MAG: hypothetical protein M1816_007507 [Peltula sp. TS41687]|nr:MAG: hypothetical protein M1816_007507 [Peltula sp. TS41687]